MYYHGIEVSYLSSKIVDIPNPTHHFHSKMSNRKDMRRADLGKSHVHFRAQGLMPTSHTVQRYIKEQT